MGPTGTGKSTFINIATGSECAIVGHNLDSCTQDIAAFTFPHPNDSNRNIVFVDTPGFDDSNRTDYDILRDLSRWLETTYKRGITLTGILFFHRISDSRMRGTPLKNLAMFEELCGNNALRNVILTTTMWNEIDNEIGIRHEEQLKTQFWEPVMMYGGRIARFSSTYDSAWEIINQFDINSRQAVLTQTEMVEQGKNFSETSAFDVLAQWWKQLVNILRKALKRTQLSSSERSTLRRKLNAASRQQQAFDVRRRSQNENFGMRYQRIHHDAQLKTSGLQEDSTYQEVHSPSSRLPSIGFRTALKANDVIHSLGTRMDLPEPDAPRFTGETEIKDHIRPQFVNNPLKGLPFPDDLDGMVMTQAPPVASSLIPVPETSSPTSDTPASAPPAKPFISLLTRIWARFSRNKHTPGTIEMQPPREARPAKHLRDRNVQLGQADPRLVIAPPRRKHRPRPVAKHDVTAHVQEEASAQEQKLVQNQGLEQVQETARHQEPVQEEESDSADDDNDADGEKEEAESFRDDGCLNAICFCEYLKWRRYRRDLRRQRSEGD
ncbi:hypothetical protein BJ138DRAFT_1156161 [Hygrophoropsis aurantiaca]|uniref:Uncharacterized protein n=1 Tax=Hygrophoropsis aurantiaca TaxID=72124 RepID=A0ACB8A6G3_9AGAM|nr:hypothetical protein BJ138DRAFT_1156161 [Hygrophoropsis aurantiaca]